MGRGGLCYFYWERKDGIRNDRGVVEIMEDSKGTWMIFREAKRTHEKQKYPITPTI